MAEAGAAAPATAPSTATAPNSGTIVPASGTSSAAPLAPITADAAPAPAAPDTKVRLAKPIRPIPELPGVFPDGDPFPATSLPTADADAGRATTPPRGPDGKFVSPSSVTDGGEHTREPATPAEPPADAPFEIGGERFPSKAAADQNFRTLRGQFRPVQALAKTLGGVEHVVPQFARAAESARGWKAAHDALQAELAARSGAQPAATTTPAAPAPAAQPADAPADVDWDLYAEVKKLAIERNEPWKAEQWLIEQVRAADRAHLQKLLDERDAPLKAQQARAADVSRITKLFGQLADYVHADGSPAFPELHDPAAAYEVGRIWASLGMPREYTGTPQGAISAIAVYRMAKQGSSAPQASAVPSAPPPVPAPPAPPTDTLSAATLTDGRPTVASVPGNGAAPSPEAARILAALRSTNQPGRSATLGFEA